MKPTLIAFNLPRPFEPAIVLPSQLAEYRPYRCTPEVRLAAAVLEDAVQCISRAVHTRTGRLRREFIEARKWFSDDRYNGLFAFRSVCDLLGLDASAVRRRVHRMIATQGPRPVAACRYRRVR